MGNAFGGLLSLIWLIIIIWAIVKVAKSGTSTLAKVIWILVLIFFPLIGFIAWLVFGPKG
ncbi:MAG: PLDc N-terminal domain-containing protein [Halomonas sp.]|nr:PLDc N-terminal domain-containing protein [Halomonas sp.]